MIFVNHDNYNYVYEMSEIGGIFNALNANAKNVPSDEIKKNCFEKYCTDFQLNHIENWQKKRKK